MQRSKIWGMIFLWGIFICPVAWATYFFFYFLPQVQVSVGGYLLNIDAALMSILAFFVWLWLPFVIIGIGVTLFPHKAIDNVLQMRKKMMERLSISTDYDLDPHRASQVFLFRMWGLLSMVVTGLPMIVILFTWQS